MSKWLSLWNISSLLLPQRMTLNGLNPHQQQAASQSLGRQVSVEVQGSMRGPGVPVGGDPRFFSLSLCPTRFFFIFGPRKTLSLDSDD